MASWPSGSPTISTWPAASCAISCEQHVSFVAHSPPFVPAKAGTQGQACERFHVWAPASAAELGSTRVQPRIDLAEVGNIRLRLANGKCVLPSHDFSSAAFT